MSLKVVFKFTKTCESDEHRKHFNGPHKRLVCLELRLPSLAQTAEESGIFIGPFHNISKFVRNRLVVPKEIKTYLW